MKNFNQQIIDKVLEKIENELDFITVDEVIEYSGFSYFHFHRLFCAYVGENLKTYIKRIRLEKAAYRLNYFHQNITNVAIEAGYHTPSAFNKAFKEMFGTTPSKYKKIPLPLKEFVMIEPIRVETMSPIEVYSVRHVGDYMKVGDAYEKIMGFLYTQKIKFKKNVMGKEAFTYMVSYDDPNVTDKDKLRSDICVSATDELELPEGIKRQQIEGGKYAVFLHKGEYTKLKDTYDAIFNGWVKTNDIQLRDVPAFEKYLNRDPRRTKPQNLKTEIYIPIK
ncbi:AraC family transcriptional regulator [Sulfurimonas sp.]|uniref:AraC family transcriptional regulator n=1 Tax=Sulfurimonas sp. TaxID=2022749 RepID=UPI003D124022